MGALPLPGGLNPAEMLPMALDEAGKTAAKAAIATLKGLVKVDDDNKEIADILHADAHSIYQIPFRGGITRGTKDEEGKTSVEKTERERIQAELDRVTNELGELRKKNPDAAQVRAELEPRIQAEKDARKRDADEARKRLESALLDTTRAMVRLHLQGKELGVKELPANYLVTTALGPEMVRFTKEGKIEVLGGDGLPESIASGTDVYKHLAAKLAEKATPEDKVSTAVEGSGSKGKGDQKGALSPKAALAEQIRNEVKEKQERQSDRPSLESRLRGDRGAQSGRRGLGGNRQT